MLETRVCLGEVTEMNCTLVRKPSLCSFSCFQCVWHEIPGGLASVYYLCGSALCTLLPNVTGPCKALKAHTLFLYDEYELVILKS